ncbi:probable enoyl-CoA hydratase isoform X2 [Bacillus rossius redtenbacheri]|uniref:probable enoyl-CoA hydratase isoform X2 n=1 Tax=Bacillus rossius redtenbacheri TaxID=93214 RepID=UPI002FDD939F
MKLAGHRINAEMQGACQTRMRAIVAACESTRLFARNLDNGMFYTQKCLRSTEEKENDEVIVGQVGGVTTIGINRPQKRNCINDTTVAKLLEAFSRFESDDGACVGVLYGTGGNFCAGYDLEELHEQQAHGLAALVPCNSHLRKPIVAAVSGYALGAGFELALMCDLRVVEETAVFGFFNRRFGVPSVSGGTVRLQAVVGLSRALDLILTGRPVKSEEALACGLANRVVACGTALGQAVNLASSMRKFPQASLSADRISTYYAAFAASSMKDALTFERDNAQDAIEKETFGGAAKFVSGIGKHGEFKNISDSYTPVKPQNKLKKV